MLGTEDTAQNKEVHHVPAPSPDPGKAQGDKQIK